MEANREREKKILKGTKYSLPAPSHCDTNVMDDASSKKQLQMLRDKGTAGFVSEVVTATKEKCVCLWMTLKL
ncbi:unnamed protein product [Urochloa humidicola]